MVSFSRCIFTAAVQIFDFLVFIYLKIVSLSFFFFSFFFSYLFAVLFSLPIFFSFSLFLFFFFFDYVTLFYFVENFFTCSCPVFFITEASSARWFLLQHFFFSFF